MLLSGKNILVNGCGITYSKQKHKTWVNFLQFIGCDIIDASGPAVSNQWIINKTFLGLLEHPDIKTAVVQLTNLGKLDVEVDLEKIEHLVRPDPLRNFIIDFTNQVKSGDQIGDFGVWPSSVSTFHSSKQHWRKWLYSPGLEKEDLHCKLLLLDNFCKQNNIKLYVYQGYSIDWSSEQLIQLQHIIKNINSDFYSVYKKSCHYQSHDFVNQNSVPGIGYQLELAQLIGNELPQWVQEKLLKFKLAYDKSR
jgi:hypothetical protein